MKKRLLIIFAFVLIGISGKVQAYDFSENSNGQTLYFNITSANEPFEVEVTYQDIYSSYYYTPPVGGITIPETVYHNGNMYSVTSIGDNAFYNCQGLTSVSIPYFINSIGDYAFYGCSALTSLPFHHYLTSIGDYAFYGCSNLTIVTFPNNITTIGDYTFYNCHGLTSINLPWELTSIGDYAFSGCHGLTSITLSESIVSIGNEAFANCIGLTTVNYNVRNNNLVPYDVFVGCPLLKTFNLWENVRSAPILTLYNITNINVSDYNFNYASIEGFLLNKTKTNLLLCPRGKTGEIIVPNTVSSIDNKAFQLCIRLTSITLPNSLISIGDNAFHSCMNLTSIIFPNTLTSIGEYAFFGCSLLTSIVIPNSVTSFGNHAFCSTGLTSVTLPNTMSSIPSYLFCNNSSLTSITIPNSVTSIDNGAFLGCSGLTSITFLGQPPYIASDAFASVPTNIPAYVYCNLTMNYYLTSNFNFTNIIEMPCPALTDTTEYIEIKGANTNISLTVQGGSGIKWIKKGNENPVFYPGVVFNINNSSNERLRIYGDFTSLDCSNNSLNFIDISHNTFLENLDCSGNSFDSLSFNSSILRILSCGGSQLRHINLNGCIALKEADFSNQKKLKKLDISNLPSFTTLKCDYSAIANIKAGNSPNFNTIYCKEFASSCTYDSLFASLPTRNYWNFGNLYFGTSLTTEESTCRDNIALTKGWKSYYRPSNGNTLLKAPNTEFSCFIVNIIVEANAGDYGYVTGSGSYEEGDDVVLSAIPYESNSFLYWNDGDTNATRTISAAHEALYTAIFRHFDIVYDTVSICEDANYQFFNTILNYAGDYTYTDTTLTTFHEINKLILQVRPISYTTLTMYICQGETYSLNGFNESLAGTYIDTLQAENGCDSIITLILIVSPIYNDTIIASICQNQTYSLNGFNENEAGFYTQFLQTVNGCDSIVNLSIIVNPIYTTNFDALICQGESYTLNGFNETTTGVYTQNLETIKGCDSIVNLNLIVNPLYIDTIIASICQGNTYTANGFNESIAGVYTLSLQTINDCDSIVNLNLIVNPSYNDTIFVEICQGNTYILNGFNNNTSGFYTQNLQTISGCDSIITLNLIVNPIYNDTILASICQGNIYTANGFNENIPGVYTQNLQTINGCDSIVNLKLIVNPIFNDTIYAEICQEDNYSLNGFNENTTGFYTQNLETINGCDSIVNLSLIVNPVYNVNFTAFICQGEVYNQFGFNESAAGLYTQSLQTINGCDSIIALNLIVNLTNNYTITASICQGETYNLNSFNENEAGFYTQNLETAKGCDSIVNLSLIVNPVYNDTITSEICQGDIYTLNGFSENTTGFYTQSLQTTKGCDSIVDLNLIVNPTYFITHNETLCKGELYSSFGFNFIADTTGLYIQNLQTIKGCDSVINLSLIVNPIYDDTITAVICQGDIYSLNGFNETLEGFYTQELQTTKGCDSIVNLSLIVNPIYNDTITIEICQGEVYNQFEFNESLAGFYTQRLQTNNGCDSIKNLNLIVNPIYNDTITASICYGSTYSLNGFNESTDGFYTQNLQTIKGCDSIVNLSLVVIIPPTIELDMVTVNSDNNNMVIWNKEELVNHYNIYREGITSSQYDLIATVPYSDNSMFVDTNSNPTVKAYIYKISATDTCMNESELSPFHKTMHLTISQGVGGNWNLYWTPYIGTDYSTYNIYRGINSLDSLEYLTTISSNNTSYTDINVKANYVYYQIEIIKDAPIAKTNEGQSIRSNIVTNNTISLPSISYNDISIILYPNPTRGKATLEVEGLTKSTEVFIYDITGRYLKTYKLKANQKELNIDLTGFAKGIYQVKVLNKTKKLIVN